jgi:ATP-dependent Zn protease
MESIMTHTIGHCDRPWWKRPPTWFIAIAALALLMFAVVELDGSRPATPYSTFLDQLDADNVVSLTFQGTEISGRFKPPAGDTKSSSAAQGDTFRSRVPEFGDPALIPELRKHRVAIDVMPPSTWSWLLGRIPWPMLVILTVVLVAALSRVWRGGQVFPGSPRSAMPMPRMGMIGILTGLFQKESSTPKPTIPESDQPRKP